MTSKQRAYLKGLASTLNATFQVGKASLTPELTKAVDESLLKNELVKIAVLKNCLDDPGEIAQMIAERTLYRCIILVTFYGDSISCL